MNVAKGRAAAAPNSTACHESYKSRVHGSRSDFPELRTRRASCNDDSHEGGGPEKRNCKRSIGCASASIAEAPNKITNRLLLTGYKLRSVIRSCRDRFVLHRREPREAILRLANFRPRLGSLPRSTRCFTNARICSATSAPKTPSFFSFPRLRSRLCIRFRNDGRPWCQRDFGPPLSVRLRSAGYSGASIRSKHCKDTRRGYSARCRLRSPMRGTLRGRRRLLMRDCSRRNQMFKGSCCRIGWHCLRALVDVDILSASIPVE